MLVGILSDSHGRVEAVRAALKLFDNFGVGHIVHCGDVGGVEVFDEFIGRLFTFVWGNTDSVDIRIESYLESCSIPAPTVIPTRIEIDGKKFAVFHGHEREADGDLQRFGVDYVLHGHSHEKRDERFGNVRVINPGALHRCARKTVATLDLGNDRLEFHAIAKS
ncbi:MAG: YfcE family phosphodiesterase [Planctomycetota bacterium]